MAYKFQLGEAQLSGALVQEGAIKVHSEAGTEVANFSQAGVVSGSGNFSVGGDLIISNGDIDGSSATGEFAINMKDNTAEGFMIRVNGDKNFATFKTDNADERFTSDVAFYAGSTLDATGLASLDGGINTNDDFTVDTDGNVVGVAGTFSGLASLDGGINTNDDFTVDTDGNVVGVAGTLSGLASLDGGINVNDTLTVSTAGAVAGATTISGSGQISAGTIELADGNFSVAADGDVNAKGLTATSGVEASSLSASANVTLAGASLITAPGVSLNNADLVQIDGITAGTVTLSKAVVVDANKDISGFRSLTASANIVADKLFGDGSGITNINVANLDAAGSDTQVQFNNNGEFGAAAGFTFDGTGSVATSVMLSSADLKATNLVAGRLPLVSTSGLLDDNALFSYSTTRSDLNGYVALEVSSSASGSTAIGDGLLWVADSDENDILVAHGSSVDLGYQSSTDGAYFSFGIAGGNAGALAFQKDGAALYFGEDSDVSLTHVADTGLLLNSTMAIQFNDSSQYIKASSAADLDLAATTDINLDCTTVDINAALDVSGNSTLGGTLTAASLGNATVTLATDLMIINDGAGGVIKNTSLADYSTAIAGAGLLSTAGVLAVVNATNGGLTVNANDMQVTLNDLAAGAVDVAADSIAIVDATDNGSKKESIADLVSAMAGAGLAASNGQLSTQAQSVHTDFNAGVAIEEGYNVYTGSANINVALPASAGLTAGDIFVIKQGAAGDVTLTANGSDLIDGAGSIVLESPYAAVSVLFTGVANTFRIV